MPRELHFTNADREWLASIKIDPEPVVSIEQYCAAIDSAEYIAQENYRLRRHCRRLERLARRLQASSGVAAIVAAWLVIGVVAYAAFQVNKGR